MCPRGTAIGPELPCRTLALLRARTLSRAPLPQCRLQKPEARSPSLSLPPPESLVGRLQVLSPWAPSTTLAAVTPAKPTAASSTSWMLPSHSLHCGQGQGGGGASKAPSDHPHSRLGSPPWLSIAVGCRPFHHIREAQPCPPTFHLLPFPPLSFLSISPGAPLPPLQLHTPSLHLVFMSPTPRMLLFALKVSTRIHTLLKPCLPLPCRSPHSLCDPTASCIFLPGQPSTPSAFS